MKIAIIRLSALGDIIQATIVLQFIKKHYPDATIEWICEERFSRVLKNHPLINETIKLNLKDKNYLKSIKTLLRARKRGYDLAIDLQGLIKSALVARIVCKNVIGFDKFSSREGLSSLFYSKKLSINYNENIIIRNLFLVAFALDFKVDKDEILNKAQCFNTKEKVVKNRVLIAPFASEASKIYAKFDLVIDEIDADEIYICYGNDDEKQKALAITKTTKAKLLEKMSLDGLVEFVSSCALTIGNDSAITHLAWAQNRASITLFGNRPSKRNSFLTPFNLTIDTGKKIDAFKIDKSDFCINEINPNLVAKMANELLRKIYEK